MVGCWCRQITCTFFQMVDRRRELNSRLLQFDNVTPPASGSADPVSNVTAFFNDISSSPQTSKGKGITLFLFIIFLVVVWNQLLNQQLYLLNFLDTVSLSTTLIHQSIGPLDISAKNVLYIFYINNCWTLCKNADKHFSNRYLSRYFTNVQIHIYM